MKYPGKVLVTLMVRRAEGFALVERLRGQAPGGLLEARLRRLVPDAG